MPLISITPLFSLLSNMKMLTMPTFGYFDKPLLANSYFQKQPIE